jgi:uncharacterized protein YndB with AHSA1/START domain
MSNSHVQNIEKRALFLPLSTFDINPCIHTVLLGSTHADRPQTINLTAMSLFIENSITINASPTKVWDVLVNPEQTKKYMFGCEAVSDWRVGSPLLWRGQYEGKEIVFVKGTVVDIKPERLLVYTVIDPNSTIEDIPENYLTITYELTRKNGKTHFKVTQGDYSKVGDGDRRYKESYNNGEGWNPILVEIKKLVESD